MPDMHFYTNIPDENIYSMLLAGPSENIGIFFFFRKMRHNFNGIINTNDNQVNESENKRIENNNIGKSHIIFHPKCLNPYCFDFEF